MALLQSIWKENIILQPQFYFQFSGPKYPVTSEANVAAALDTCNINLDTCNITLDTCNITLDTSFRHSSIRLTTGPQPLSRRILHSLQSIVSSFNFSILSFFKVIQ